MHASARGSTGLCPWLHLLACLGVLWLTACQSLPMSTSEPDAGMLPGPAQANFVLAGRALLRQGERVDYFRFDWTHSTTSDGATDTLLLTTPFGQGIAEIARDAHGAQVRLADGRLLQGTSWMRLSQDIFGSALPIDELPEWLRGARAQRHGRADDWQVDIERLEAVGAAWLPRIVEARRDDITLRLVIDQRDARP